MQKIEKKILDIGYFEYKYSLKTNERKKIWKNVVYMWQNESETGKIKAVLLGKHRIRL